MKWQLFHFFKRRDGLSNNDSVEMAACFDYEQALESEAVVELVCSLTPAEKDWMLDRALKFPSRFTSLRFGNDVTDVSRKFRTGKLQTWEDAAKFPPVPTACIVASWFPKHWLEAFASERLSVVQKLATLYRIHRLPISNCPADVDEMELLVNSAAAEPNTTLHIIAIDRTKTRSELVQRFKAWLDKEKIEGSKSRKGKVNMPACLDDLACYRLSKLDAVKRETVMAETGFRRSVARLSAAKRRAEKRLRALNYI